MRDVPVVAKIVADEPLAESEEAVLDSFANLVDLCGADVVELGGAVPDPARHGVRSWNAVDPRHDPIVVESGPQRIIRGRAETLPLPARSADAVFSSNALQFVNVPRALAEIRRVLRPGGTAYAHFGPIWSGPDGHQLEYVSYEGRELVFWRDTLLGPYAHLMYDRQQLASILTTALPTELVELLVWHVHDSPTINRMFFEDYIAALAASGLECVEAVGSLRLDYEIATPAYDHPLLRQPDLGELAVRWAPPGEAPRALGVRDVRLIARQPR